ncbi:DUF4244 domain-containing protein [Nonomuraea sp. NPDC003804]|uniref:DUF4244 domain-containing protein n=1 Tax=Nonomuraea sp. NPDC003804 TaxID=3154547 RepID=UPI0033ACBA1F
MRHPFSFSIDPISQRLRAAVHRLWTTRLAQATRLGRDRGMSTAEYAVGTIAACGFAALLFKVVTSTEVQEMLSALVNRALNTAG